MALGTTFGALITQLQNEVGASTNPSQAQGQLPQWQNLLNRCQDLLYEKYDWPHLLTWDYIPMVAQQRYYAFGTNINFDRINKAWVNYSTSYVPIKNGITPEDWNFSNPNAETYSDPVMKWRVYFPGVGTAYTGAMFEVWPVPAGTLTQTVIFRGIVKPTRMVNTSDVAMLDDRLIVLMAASQYAKRYKQEDAEDLAKAFADHYKTLTSREQKFDCIKIGGHLPVYSTDYNGPHIRIPDPGPFPYTSPGSP